jgi:hypothetical protein
MEVVPRPLAHLRLPDDPVFPCSALGLIETASSRVSAPGRPALAHQRLFQAPVPFRLWHLASLDAPTVALIWTMAFAWVANVRLPWWVLVLLPLGVWTVYVADRLLDARAALQSFHFQHLRERHLFHWRYRSVFVPGATTSAIVAAWIIFHLMPRTAREHDALLAVASLVYFTRVHSGRKFLPGLSKELLVGAIFTFGCALPTFSRTGLSLAWWPLLIATVSFALLAWLNCYAIDRWESQDTTSGQNRIALSALLLSTGCLVGAALLAAGHPRTAEFLACGVATAQLIAALDHGRKRLTPVTLRVAADLVLLTPGMLLALAPLLRK